MNRLTTILNKKGLSQIDFQRLMEKKTGSSIGTDRISRICSGKMINYKLETAVRISDTLGVTIDSFIEKNSNIYKTKEIFDNPKYFKKQIM